MKLIRVHVISADTCGGLLDRLDLWLREPMDCDETFDPLCLVGPNGSGKSQFLQVLAEIFQSTFHACISNEERIEGNPNLQFEIEYLIRHSEKKPFAHVRISRKSEGKRRPTISIQRKDGDKWLDCNLQSPATLKLLPEKIVAYTSGDNETLSLPFLVSRSGYAKEVGELALAEAQNRTIPDTRLMLIDYGTHLEVLVSNLLMGGKDQQETLLQDARLKDLHSFRCIIQLAHKAAPKAPSRKTSKKSRKGIQLTEELENYLDNLRRCATCYSYDEKTEKYIFDFWINDQTKKAFNSFWNTTLHLYSSFHKLSMLNDLAIQKLTRERFRRDTTVRRFASRLPEPQDEDKVFRFAQVCFVPQASSSIVDYVSLSDGEHQHAQILGMFCMMSFSNVLFLLDEPESHFNPQWRVKFISQVLNIPTKDGRRQDKTTAAEQECILTTHSPFVPSDMRRNKVFIFAKPDNEKKITVRHPDIETFGTTFDTILEECFDVRPPISGVSRKEIDDLMKSHDPGDIKTGLDGLGQSVEKAFLADHLRQLTKKEEA
jgi:restriction system-associated AAA family ATPase